MLTYRAMFKFVQDGVHAEILDFPGVITFGASQEEARWLLASALVTWRRRATPGRALTPS